MKMRRYFILINIVLTALMGWSAYDIYMTLTSGRHRGSPTSRTGSPHPPKETQAGRPVGLTHYQSIIRQDIFGTTLHTQQASGAEKAEKVKIEEIPVSLRSLYLKGTVVARDNKSYAIIAEGKNAEGDVFRVNDFLHNARVLHILKDRVILESEGKEEALILTYDLEPDGKSPPAPEVPRRPTGRLQRSTPAGSRRLPGMK